MPGKVHDAVAELNDAPEQTDPSGLSRLRAPYAEALDGAIRRSGLIEEQIVRWMSRELRRRVYRQHLAEMRRGDRPFEFHHVAAMPPRVQGHLVPRLVELLTAEPPSVSVAPASVVRTVREGRAA